MCHRLHAGLDTGDSGFARPRPFPLHGMALVMYNPWRTPVGVARGARIRWSPGAPQVTAPRAPRATTALAPRRAWASRDQGKLHRRPGAGAERLRCNTSVNVFDLGPHSFFISFPFFFLPFSFSLFLPPPFFLLSVFLFLLLFLLRSSLNFFATQPAQAVAENPSRMRLPPPQRSHIGPGHAATAVPAAAALAAALPPPTPEIAPAAARAGGRVRALRVTRAAAWCCGRSEAAVALHAPRSVRGAREDLP